MNIKAKKTILITNYRSIDNENAGERTMSLLTAIKYSMIEEKIEREIYSPEHYEIIRETANSMKLKCFIVEVNKNTGKPQKTCIYGNLEQLCMFSEVLGARRKALELTGNSYNDYENILI